MSTISRASCTSIRPADHTDYVHRSGRTGRAGRTGTVVSLVTDEQRKEVQGVQRALGMEQGLLAPFSSPTPVAVSSRPYPDGNPEPDPETQRGIPHDRTQSHSTHSQSPTRSHTQKQKHKGGRPP